MRAFTTLVLVLSCAGDPVAGNAQNVPEQVSALSSQVASLNGQLSALSKRVADMADAGNAQNVPGQVSALSSQVASLNGQLSALSKRVADMAEVRNARYKNIDNKEVAYIGTSKAEDGLIELDDKGGSQRATLSGFGFGKFYNELNSEVAVIGENANKNGMLVLNNRTGDLRVFLYVDKDGGNGRIQVNGKEVADYAEIFDLDPRNRPTPGTVMSVDENDKLSPSRLAYDAKVVGVISGAGSLAPGMQIGSRPDGSSDLPVAVAGRVFVRIGLEGGEVNVGDLLVSSTTPGVAMRARKKSRAFGAVIGKALASFSNGVGTHEGLIPMLVMNR
jgi:hypothetical protein